MESPPVIFICVVFDKGMEALAPKVKGLIEIVVRGEQLSKDLFQILTYVYVGDSPHSRMPHCSVDTEVVVCVFPDWETIEERHIDVPEDYDRVLLAKILHVLENEKNFYRMKSSNFFSLN